VQTEAQLRATKASKARRIAAGEKQFTVWLSKEAGDRLDELTARHGTRQRAMESVLMGQATLVAAEPVKAVQRPEKRVSVDAVKPSKVKASASRLKGEWKAP